MNFVVQINNINIKPWKGYSTSTNINERKDYEKYMKELFKDFEEKVQKNDKSFKELFEYKDRYSKFIELLFNETRWFF